MATGTLDTNSLGATAVEVAITTETLITLYVVDKTGDHDNHRVILQVSPDDGATWIDRPPSILGEGCLTISEVTTKVRVKVLEAEGATSTVDIWILAR